MSEEELIETLKEFEKNRVEKLKEPSKNLFYAIMKIADERDKYKEILDKIKEIVDKAPCLWYVDEELERVDGTIDLTYEEYTGWKNILELLEEIE